jgi:YNFM family putative membrane transporter
MTAGAATISVPISVPISATISAAISAATRRSIFLLSLAAFSSMAAQRICAAMLPELSRVFAVSLAQAAQVVSIFAVVYGLSQLFYGPLGDRLGKFRIVTYATLWGSVGSVVAIFASSLDMLLVARALRRRQHREAS